MALHWLPRRYDAEVVASCANLGQPDRLDEVRRRALQAGAVAVHIDDQRQTYLNDHVFPALPAHTAYERRYLLAAPLGRPLIGRRLERWPRPKGPRR